MSNECCSSRPLLDFDEFLKSITWLNEDDPEANRSLLEGLKAGFTGYSVDKIIQPSALRTKYGNSEHALEGGGSSSQSSSPQSLSSSEKSDPGCDSNDEQLANLQFALYGSSIFPHTTVRPNSAPPLKRIGALTVRPTIGEERRAWILETRKAYCLDRCPNQTVSAVLSRDDDGPSYLNGTSISCPEFEGRSDCCTAKIYKLCNADTVTENKSCTYLYQHAIGDMNPMMFSNTENHASKEFMDTLRIMSTISPQESDENLCLPQADFEQVHKDARDINIDLEEEISGCPLYSEDDGASKQCGNSGRSYKEVFLYGPPRSPSPPAPSSSVVSEEPNTSYNIRSNSCFPSLPKPNLSGALGGSDNQKGSPPLWSTILQRSPTSSSNLDSQASIGAESKKTKSSLGSFDCGFCRTNNENPEIYTSHPLRINDVVVCPSLRKYVCCFCGATGDKAHTIKYCPRNPIGFFAKKSKPCNNAVAAVSERSQGECPSSTQSPDKAASNTEENDTDLYQHESKSDSESISTAEETVETTKSGSGIWIEAKPKGRKKKNIKNSE